MTDETQFKQQWVSYAETVNKVKHEIRRVIVGQERVIDELFICLLTGGHALFEGVPGLGKTLLVKTAAQCFDVPFSRIQFTPDLMPADIVGTNIITADDEGRNVFRFQPGPIFGSFVLADEINRATPKTQSALLEAMQEQNVTVAGETRPLPRPFFVLATQNPLESEGTYPLPEAQLDRFLFKIVVPFPTEAELRQIVTSTTAGDRVQPSPVTDGAQLEQIQKMVQQVLVPDEVVSYAVRMLLLTHPSTEQAPEMVKQFVRAGAGPRGGQALIQAAKARAFLDHRFNVAYEDIENVLYPCLRHRLLLNFEGEATGVQTEQLLDEVCAVAKGEQAP